MLGILGLTLVLSGCSQIKTPSAEIVGEWEMAEGFIIDACTGEIGDKPYLFVMTMGPEAVTKATIHVLDIYAPAEPVETASFETPMEIMVPLGGLALSGTELYVGLTGADEAALWVLDVSDPESPREITLMETDFAVWRPCVSGDYLAVATAIRGPVAFFDISRPAQPQWLGELRLAPIHGNVISWQPDYVGSMFYVVDRNGLAIADVSSPASPQEVGFYTNPDWEEPEDGPESVEGAGTDVLTGIEEFNTLEEMFEDMYNSGSFLDVAVSGRYAYIAATDSGLVVLDVRETESPEEVARLEIPGKAIRVLNAGDLVYVMGVNFTGGSSINSFRYSVHIVDILDPLAPELADSIEVVTTFPPFQSMIALGEYIYFLNNQTVYVIDIYGGHK